MFNISFQELQMFVSRDGQQALIDFVREAREQRGKGWIDELKKEFPNFNFVFDLVWNKTEQEALDELKAEFPILKLGIMDNKLRNLHRKLKSEIDKER